MNKNQQINNILSSLSEMLNELDRYELNDLEDFIVNECEVIGDDEPNNLFRILMYENSSVGGDDELS
jgi:hypothetical protein